MTTVSSACIALVLLGLLHSASSQGKSVASYMAEFAHGLEIASIPFNQGVWIPNKEKLTPACYNDTNEYYEAVASGARWALQRYDATGKLPNGVGAGRTSWPGNKDLCENPAVVEEVDGKIHKSKYCKTKVYHWLAVSYVEWGVCAPVSCTEDDLKNLYAKDFLLILEAFCPEDNKKDFGKDGLAIGATVIFSIIGALVLVASLLDAFYIKAKNRTSSTTTVPKSGLTNGGFENGPTASAHDNQIYHLSELPTTQNGTTQPTLSESTSNSYTLTSEPVEKGPSVPMRMLTAFSFYSNFPSLLSADPPRGTLKCLNGIRVLSTVFIILYHSSNLGLSISQSQTIANPIAQGRLFQSYYWQPMVTADVAVDAFLVIGGLLNTYIFCKQLAKISGFKSHVIMILKYLLHRYWRLTPVYALIIFFTVSYTQYIGGNGTFWPKEGLNDAEGCREHWWANLLYINNYIPGKFCVGWCWYLAVDMQCYIFAPIFMIPLFKKPVVGIILTVVIFCVYLGGRTWHIYHTFFVAENANYFFDVYMKFHARVGPYLMGILLGYFLYRRKCKVKMNKVVVIGGWIICLVALHLATYGQYTQFKENPVAWAPATTTAYQSAKRPLFAGVVCWVCFACLTGYGGIINDILSWNGWVPMSRLSYTAYLIHPVVIYLRNYNTAYSINYSVMDVTYLFLGHAGITYLISAIAYCVFELPSLKLDNILLRKRK